LGEAKESFSEAKMRVCEAILIACKANQPVGSGTLQVPQLSPFNEKLWAS